MLEIHDIIDREAFAQNLPYVVFNEIATEVCPIEHMGQMSAVFVLGFDAFAVERKLSDMNHYGDYTEVMSETYYYILRFNAKDVDKEMETFKKDLTDTKLLEPDQPKIVYELIHLFKEGGVLKFEACTLPIIYIMNNVEIKEWTDDELW